MELMDEKKINRPELLLFSVQKERLDAGKKLINSADMPKLFAFSQVAYGRPGYNMISADFHGFYSVGVGLKWDFLNYGNSKRQKQQLELQMDLVSIKEDNFNDLLHIQLENEQLSIEKYQMMMEKDEKIIALRKTVTEASFAKLQRGVITPNEYLTDQREEMLARLQTESHKILKLKSEYNLQLLKGNL